MVSERDELANSDDIDGENVGYLRIDEFGDVVASLKLLCEASNLAKEQPIYWKWIILSAHSALQGACVCLLTHTDGSGALDQNSEKRLRNYHQLTEPKAITESAGGNWILEPPEPPVEKIANLPDLLRRLPVELRIDLPAIFQQSMKQPELDFFRLHEWRNRLTHFPVLHWSIELVGLPGIIKRAVDLTEKIVRHDGYRRRNRFVGTDAHNLIVRAKEKVGALGES